MQLIPDLTLEMAVQMVRQAEDVKEQMSQQLLQASLNVHEVAQQRPWRRGERQLGAVTGAAEQARSVKKGVAGVVKKSIAPKPHPVSNARKCRKRATGFVCPSW